LLPLHIGFYRDFGSDRVRQSGQAAFHIVYNVSGGHGHTAASALSCCSREKTHNRKRDEKYTIAIPVTYQSAELTPVNV
jgi:hypothetical protein